MAVDINPAALEETAKIAGKNPRLFTEVVDISKSESVSYKPEEICGIKSKNLNASFYIVCYIEML